MKSLTTLFVCSTIVFASAYSFQYIENKQLKDEYSQCQYRAAMYQKSTEEMAALAKANEAEAKEAQQIAKEAQDIAKAAQAEARKAIDVGMRCSELVSKYSALINSR